jgi:hypothetical protein
MKTITKVVVSGAVLAGAAVAAHASTVPVPMPSTDSSEMILIVQNTSTGATYDLVLDPSTPITVGSGSGSYFNSADANTAGPVAGSSTGTIFGDPSFTVALSGDTALQTFLTSAGSNVSWAVMGGAYSGSIASQRATRGNTLIVTTGTAASVLPISESLLDNSTAVDLNSDVKNFNLGTFDSFNGQTNAFIGSSGTSDASLNLYGTGAVQGATLGSTSSLYGLTSDGTSADLAYLLGTFSFNGTTLTFTGESTAVPIPAAAWLFGSGLLGLLGISRRRRDAAAA